MNTEQQAVRETVFSPCRLYRYTLWREWGDYDPIADVMFGESRGYIGKRDQYLQVIGLNPSTADEVNNDPTIRRCIDFAKQWGFGALCMTNLFAFRATDPRVMKGHSEPVGPDSDHWLIQIGKQAGLVVAAWGTHGAHLERGKEVSATLMLNRVQLHCLGRNADGSPKHPLYLPKTVRPELL